MPTIDDVKALVARVPDPDPNGTYANLDQAKIEAIGQLVPELLKGGRDTVLGVIDMLVEPGQGNDVKPHFALHLAAVHVTGLGDEKARADFALALASQIGGDRPKAVQEYLIQELGVAGGKEVVETLGKALLDTALCDAAARALAAIGNGAADQFLAALPKVQGRGRLSVIKKLAILKCAKAADVFKQALADEDPDIRIAGAWGIARLGDASAADALLKVADAHEGWERNNETDACLALAEGLLVAGKKAEALAIYTHLQKTRTEPPERHVLDAAERAITAAG
ncbi:MAG TPA: HEAT repeat domain-containing protein [Phycisphaerae bacterium]|nr:HEAT repeat domain-containing protein [Phycisphaerae bacterium]